MKHSHFIKRLVMFDSFGFGYQEFYEKLSPVYLVSSGEAKQIVSLIGDEKYRAIRNSRQLAFLNNCIALYGIKYFGSTKAEGEILAAKKEVFSFLEKKFGDVEFDKALLWECGDTAFAKSIIGTVHYYGIERAENKELGEKLLREAADMGDVDALLWCIHTLPEKRKYMQKIISLPESLAAPEWLEPVKDKYEIYDVQEMQTEKRKIGF